MVLLSVEFVGMDNDVSARLGEVMFGQKGGGKLGEIKQHVVKNIDLDLYYAFCVGATFGMIRHWKNTNYKLTPGEMGVYITRFFQYQNRDRVI